MKKNFIYVAAIACATLSLSSCKKDAKPADSETPTEQKQESSSSINSVDQAIDEYGKFVDEYVDILKKSSTGDVDAAKKMQEMAPKFQEITQKFQNTSSYTPAQIERLNAIAKKITDAMTQK